MPKGWPGRDLDFKKTGAEYFDHPANMRPEPALFLPVPHSNCPTFLRLVAMIRIREYPRPWRGPVGIEKGQALAQSELGHVTAVIERWLRKQSVGVHVDPAQGWLL
jgi:hypothetical protein